MMQQLSFSFAPPKPKGEPPTEGIYTVYGLRRKTITVREAMHYLPGFSVQEIAEMQGIQHVAASDLDDRFLWLDEIDVIDWGRNWIWLNSDAKAKPTQEEYFKIINF